MKGASDKLENIPDTIKSIPEAKAYYDATLKMLEVVKQLRIKILKL